MKTPSLLKALTFVPFLAVAATAGACSSDGDSSGDGDSAGDGDNSGDGDGADFLFCSPADTCPPSIDGVDLTTSVSFTNDIYHPFFKVSCGGGSGCHGRASSPAANLHLGTEDSPLDDAAIEALVTQLKEADSVIAPGNKNVIPMDWQGSFLMAKLDGCQNQYSFVCDEEADEQIFSVCDGTCGDGMPASEGDASNPNPFPTTAAEREMVHKVRAWIAQGAEYN